MVQKMAELDLKALFEKFGCLLNECEIIRIPKGTRGNTEDEYELYEDGKFLCMNKEFVPIIKIGAFSGKVTLKSNEPNGCTFTLTKREFDCATQSNLKEPEPDYDDWDIWLSAV